MPAAPYTATGSKHLTLWLSRLTYPSFVYVLQVEQGPIKVGFARDVDVRIASLQTGNPYKLRLLFVLPGDQRLEWFLHRRLKGVRMRGEWFRPGPITDSFLRYVADLAEKMVDAYVEGSCTPPHYASVDPTLTAPGKRQNPVIVTYVEPSPKMPAEEAQEIRRLAQLGIVPMNVEPPSTWTRAPTPGRARHGGR